MTASLFFIMITPMHSLKRLILSLIGLVALAGPTSVRADDQPAGAPAGTAQSQSLGVPAGTVPIPVGLRKDDVQELIALVFTGRGWAVQDKSDGKVVGYLKHRSNEATVTMLYDDKQVTLYCVGYRIEKSTGERKGPEQPTGWLKNLRNDLTKRFNASTAAPSK